MRSLPEVSLSTHRQVLKNEPETSLAFGIVEPAGIDSVHADEITGVVLVERWWSRYRHGHGRRILSIAILCSVLWIGTVSRIGLVVVLRHRWLSIGAGRWCSTRHWIPPRYHLSGHVHWTLWWWGITCNSTARNGDRWSRTTVPDQVDGTC